MTPNVNIYYDIAKRAIESVFESEYHNTLGIPMPQIKILMPDDADYITGQYYIMIDDTWQIHLNFGKLPVSFKEFEDEVKVLTRHEVEHYMCCPFDVITHLRMLKCIMEVYKNEFDHLGIDIRRICGSISNQAADIIVDTKNYFRNPHDTVISEVNWIKKGADIKNCPHHCKLMFLTKEALWGTSLEINETDQDLLDIVHKLAETFKVDGIENRALFLNKTKEYARTFFRLYLKDKLYPQNDEQQSGQSQNSQPQQGNQSQQSGQPQHSQSQQSGQSQYEGDVMTSAKPKDGDKNGSAFAFANPDKIKEAITALAEETDVQEFSDILSAAGIKFLTESEKYMLWFSVQGADVIPIEEYTNSGNKEKYTYPSIWKVGDPIGSLDIMLSFMTSPKILPGITTKKWDLATRDTDGSDKRQRDLLLIVDTSGSMGSAIDKGSNMHQAIKAAYGIITYFEQNAGKIALLGFNDKITTEIDWTNDYNLIREALLTNGGGGTLFPIKKIESILDQRNSDMVTVLITDGEISNIAEAVKYFRDYIFDGNKLYIFILGKSRTRLNYDPLKEIGAQVYSASTANEFCNFVLSDLI